MLISNNSLLNILLPNDNKVLNNVLKEADVKTLNNIKSGNTTVGDILKNLFTDLKTGDKSKATIENLLKNSNLFKDLGSFSKSITTLINQIDQDSNLSKYKSQLESFLKDISTLDNKSLKDLIAKSGVFLESKALDQLKAVTNLPKNLEAILGQIKTILKDIPTLDAKKIENLIDRIFQNNIKPTVTSTLSNTSQTSNLQNNSDLKTLVGLLQNLSKNTGDKQLANLTILTNNLKNISTQAQLIESKITNQVNIQGNSQQTEKLETILGQIKTALKDIPTLDAKKIESLIDKILQNNTKTTTPPTSTLTNTSTIVNTPQTSNLQNNPDLKTLVGLLENLSKNVRDKTLSNLSKLTDNLKNISAEAQLGESKTANQTNIQGSTQQTLLQLKNELILSKNIPNAPALIKQIDTLLQSNDLFSKNQSQIEPKNLLTQLINLNEIKNISTQNSNISSLITNLKNQIETINTLESKVLQNQNIQPEKLQLTQDINQTLTSLKNTLSNVSNIDTKAINQIIDKLLNIQNLFAKIDLPVELRGFQQNTLNQTTNLNNFQSNFSSNINNLLLTLKENITNLSTNINNLNFQQNIMKTVEKLETIVNNFIQNFPHNAQIGQERISQQNNPLQNDMKTVLLQMQEELVGKSDIKSTETFKQVDKMLMQVEYYQLLSIASNSNSVYIPFIWDMLDDGSISMKKLEQEKFYCEINLSLKEFGQTQLLLALYDTNKLDLTIYASKDSFKQSIRENSAKLKQALNSVDLIPVNIKIIDFKKEQEKPKEQQQADVYNQNANLGLGINIKA